MQTPELTVYEWVEQLGGWAVVVYVVVWGTRSAASARQTVDNMLRTFQDAVASFQTFERQEHEAHENIMRELQSIKDYQRHPPAEREPRESK